MTHADLIAEARETFGGHTAREVAELLDALASAADRCEANSYSEIASISRRGSAAIRRLAAALEEATKPKPATTCRHGRFDIIGMEAGTQICRCLDCGHEWAR